MCWSAPRWWPRGTISRHHPGGHHLRRLVAQLPGFPGRRTDVSAPGAGGRRAGAASGRARSFSRPTTRRTSTSGRPRSGLRGVLRKGNRFPQGLELPAGGAHDPAEDLRPGPAAHSAVGRAAGGCCRALKAAEPENFAALDILGPAEAALARIAGNFRWQVLLKSLNGGALHRFMDRLIAEHPQVFAARPKGS